MTIFHAITVLVLVFPPFALGADDVPARILPLGDSLTLGVQGVGGGYRTPLGQALKGYGAAYNAGFVGGLYFAGDHSGYSGHTLQGILSAVKGARTLELNNPTHVLLLGGTNDFYFFPPLGANASTAVGRLETLLTFLLDRPNPPQVFLSTVPPVLVERCAVYSQGPCAPTIATNIEAYNRALPATIDRVTAAMNHTATIHLVNMSQAGFAGGDYWTAGIHFNDNGWCKMARVWASSLMPTLPKRSLGASASSAATSASSAAFAEITAPPTPTCVIPGATEPTLPVRADAAATAAAATAATAGQRLPVGPAMASTTCATTVTVNASGHPDQELPFSVFYGTVAAALSLKFADHGAFCAWTSLAPRQYDLAPWANHGAADAAGVEPSPSGPLFEMFQTLGSKLLRLQVQPSKSATVPLALATVRGWSTQSTVSVLVNVTSNSGGGVCLEITGLDPSVVAERCGFAGSYAATVIELRSSPNSSTTHTRMIPCLRRGDGDPGTTAVFELRAGALSSLSFATTHL